MSEQSKEITFYVAECMEFPDLGECHKDIPTIKEAYEIYKTIPADRISGIKGIGFELHDGSFYDGIPQGILWGKHIDREVLELIDYFKENPLVNQAIDELEAVMNPPKQVQDEKVNSKYVPLYLHNVEYARGHNELDACAKSNRENVRCKDAIQKAIQDNYDGKSLANVPVRDILDEFGEERVSFILANTVEHQLYEGRYSPENRRWQETVQKVERARDPSVDNTLHLVIGVHPGVLDTFITMTRREIKDRNVYLPLAKEMISDYWKEEFPEILEKADDDGFSDLTNVGLAYTTIGDNDTAVQVSADLLNYKVKTYLNNELFDVRTYRSLSDMIERELENLDFDSLVDVEPEIRGPKL